MKPLAGKHVLVTGASRGLGRSIADRCHRDGARVSLVGRSQTELGALVEQFGERAAYFAGDLAAEGTITDALAFLTREHGPVDILVNNAGIGAYKPFVECTAGELAAQVALNVTALILLTHAVVPSMVERGAGTIVNIASDLARKPLPNMAVYTATKHAVAGFSTSLARELRTSGIRVCLVNPGIINTHFGGNAPKSVAENWQLNPADVADAVAHILNAPANVLIDELTIHPLGQDF
jgi:short-subunit dehydrogenase